MLYRKGFTTVTTNELMDVSVMRFNQKEKLMSRVKNRFLTYGYEQIETSTFESYDLYSNVAGTIPQDEMIKVIDSTGRVLVLRPDVTIPVTEEVAKHGLAKGEVKRYFYMLDVFRQSFTNNGTKERTQAGVECFGDDSRLGDAEIIALAIHTLDDLGDFNFKIEIGHAGFFKKLASRLNIDTVDFQKLKQYIQQKNITEIKPFLETLHVEEDIIEAISSIPLLYGRPSEVIERAKSIVLSDTMTEELNYLKEVHDLLLAYGIEDKVVLDLGLINHMNYYTDLIFQGFIENVSNPVLMGGRYNHLAEEFSKEIPAIGFACDIDLLLESIIQQDENYPDEQKIAIVFDETKRNEALETAFQLRRDNFSVVLTTEDKTMTNKQIILTNSNKTVITGTEQKDYESIGELKKLLK